jgi:type IV pilus assembly protein PilV
VRGWEISASSIMGRSAMMTLIDPETAPRDPTPCGLAKSYGRPASSQTLGLSWSGLRTRGFSLVEVLVAVIVLAVGLLGIAGLQVSVLKTNDSARLRTLATLASYDAIDRIRADPGGLLAESKPVSIPGNYCQGDISKLCASAFTASEAVDRWKQNFCCAFQLPDLSSGDAMTIDCTKAAASACGVGNCQIIVRWNDARGDPKSVDSKSAERPATFQACTRLPVL